MMDGLDYFLLGIGSLLTVTAIVFSLVTASRHNNRAGRLWSAALVAGAASTVFSGIPRSSDEYTRMLGLFLITMAFILLWSGFRALARQPSPTWPAFVVALAVVLVEWFDSTPTRLPDGLLLAITASGVASFMTARELGRGEGATNLHARILRTTLRLAATAAVVGVGFVVYLVAVDRLLTAELVGGVQLGIAAVMLIAVLCISALRVELTRQWWTNDGHLPDLEWRLGVMPWRGFVAAAADRMERTGHYGGRVTALVVDLQYLDEMNIAFGRAAGDESLAELGQLLRTCTPASALLGHVGAGRFVVLLDSSMRSEPDAVLESVARGLQETWRSESSRQRISARYGTASTECEASSGQPGTLEALILAASTEMAPIAV